MGEAARGPWVRNVNTTLHCDLHDASFFMLISMTNEIIINFKNWGFQTAPCCLSKSAAAVWPFSVAVSNGVQVPLPP